MTEKANDRIGYGKPPQHSRWQKGQSGNPAGRPRRDMNIATLTSALLRQRIVVRHGKTTRRVTRLEHLLTTLIEKAIAGDPRSIKLALDELRKDEARTDDTVMDLDSRDEEVIKSLCERLLRHANTPSDHA